VSARTGKLTPTIDFRIDYQLPAVTDLTAEAAVLRLGATIASVVIRVYDTDGGVVATAQGTFKTGGMSSDSPWNKGRESAFPRD
jgi:uncharacterized protein (TIGR00369 family)